MSTVILFTHRYPQKSKVNSATLKKSKVNSVRIATLALCYKADVRRSFDTMAPYPFRNSSYLLLRGIMSGVSIVVADGWPLFLCGLISVLRSERDFDIIARCCNGIESLQAIRDLSPDIALLDSSMPMASGIKVLASAISEGSQTRIVLLAGRAEMQSIFAVANGAYGIVPRDVLPEVLIHELRQVAAGRRLPIRASRAGETRATTDTSEKALALLTKRERQIVKLVSAGLPNKEVGRQLNLTAGTIKVHLHNIFAKLALKNRSALTALAVSDRYISRRADRQTSSNHLTLERRSLGG